MDRTSSRSSRGTPSLKFLVASSSIVSRWVFAWAFSNEASSAMILILDSSDCFEARDLVYSARRSDRWDLRCLTLGERRIRLLAAKASLASDRKSTRLNSSHVRISYAVFCLKKKKKNIIC